MNIRIALVIFTSMVLPSFASAQTVEQNAARLTALEVELSSKQVIGDFAATHSGMYDVYYLESNAYACGSTVDFPSLKKRERLFYFSTQAISSMAYRSATATASADGSTLIIGLFNLRKVETRLGGLAEISTVIDDGPIEIDINPDGTLSIDFEPGEAPESFTGSMSADGSMFTILVDVEEFDGTDPVCTDTARIYITGYRH